ncbi:MAG: DUF5684 domain-containing protein [Verrucomicrobia bacterium]|nr:DUF5684 domain-containing protein [Verrucomicrobiota bacterium]
MNTFTDIFMGLLEQVCGSRGVGREEIILALFGLGMILLAGYVISLIGIWKVFTKAGQPGWAVLIPIYNFIVLLRIAGLPWYWVFTPLVAIIPILGWIACLVWVVWVHHRISTRFGQGGGFTIGLTLLSPIFWLILGFGSSKYNGEQPAQA